MLTLLFTHLQAKVFLKKSVKEFQGLVNNYFKLASALSIILFQLELLLYY